MPFYAVQLQIFPTSNRPEDAVTNSFSCSANSTGDALLFTNQVVALYDTYRAMFPNIVRQTNHVYKIFNRADPKPRQPVAEGLWSFGAAPTMAPAPPEVAHCMSFQGDALSGVPQARRRGRVYFGPLRIERIDTDGRPNATQMATLDAFGTDLLAASVAAAGWNWTVHSSVLGVGDAIITNGWVDNEFDTQRRRGRVATARSLF